MVDGHTVEAGQLSRTVAGLCAVREQVSTGPLAAKSTYDQRARNGIEITIRALRSSYSVLAARLAEASAAVDADLATDPPRPSLGLNVGGLTEKMREGLARLGISTTACPK